MRVRFLCHRFYRWSLLECDGEICFSPSACQSLSEHPHLLQLSYRIFQCIKPHVSRPKVVFQPINKSHSIVLRYSLVMSY